MPVEQIHISPTARDQLVTLTRRTKITHRNVLMRWAFCRSLAEQNPPQAAKHPTDSSIPPISWSTFAGGHGDELWALLRMRCHADGLSLDEETLAMQFRLHLHRGLGYLVGDPRITDATGIAGLVSLALEEQLVA
jgi:DNA sulfur modification protein DndE